MQKKRKCFVSVIDKASNPTKENDTMQSSDESIIDEYMADFGSSYESSDVESILSESFSESDNIESINSAIEVPNVEKKENIFVHALAPTARKICEDKVDLTVVRDFCHEMCRLDTFASTKVYVHNYDGTHSYHQVHIRSQSIKNYYTMFLASSEYFNWQNENRRIKKRSQTGEYTIPTIKLSLFSNAFCPCCMNQKQRDCANHIQINYYKALKALSNLRKYHGISVPIKNCTCSGHNNAKYLAAHLSSSDFMNAVLCKKTEYKSLLQLIDPSKSITEQQLMNIRVRVPKGNT